MITKIRTVFMVLVVGAVLIGASAVYQTVTTEKRPRHGAMVTVTLPGDGPIIKGRDIRVTVRVGGRWEVRDRPIAKTPWVHKVEVPEGDRVYVEAVETQERWAFLKIMCSIHNDMGHLLDEGSGYGRTQCEALV